MTAVRAFWRDERGATAIEYAMIAGFVSILIVGGATLIGTKLKAYFVSASGNLT